MSIAKIPRGRPDIVMMMSATEVLYTLTGGVKLPESCTIISRFLKLRFTEPCLVIFRCFGGLKVVHSELYCR